MLSKSQQFVFFTPNLTYMADANEFASFPTSNSHYSDLTTDANFVRNSRNGQNWSVKHELLRFAEQILSPTFNSLGDC